MKDYINQQNLNHNPINAYDQITDTIHAQGYDEQLSAFLCSMLKYMQNEQWRGACHAACSIMYVALSELGYDVKLCIGEVKAEKFCFDHSWVLLDDKIIDLAVAMILIGGLPISNSIVLDTDIGTGKKHTHKYGIYKGGLDQETEAVRTLPFVEYMDNYPKVKNGLWGVLALVFPGEIDIESLRVKYKDVERHYICSSA